MRLVLLGTAVRLACSLREGIQVDEVYKLGSSSDRRGSIKGVHTSDAVWAPLHAHSPSPSRALDLGLKVNLAERSLSVPPGDFCEVYDAVRVPSRIRSQASLVRHTVALRSKLISTSTITSDSTIHMITSPSHTSTHTGQHIQAPKCTYGAQCPTFLSPTRSLKTFVA